MQTSCGCFQNWSGLYVVSHVGCVLSHVWLKHWGLKNVFRSGVILLLRQWILKRHFMYSFASFSLAGAQGPQTPRLIFIAFQHILIGAVLNYMWVHNSKSTFFFFILPWKKKDRREGFPPSSQIFTKTVQANRRHKPSLQKPAPLFNFALIGASAIRMRHRAGGFSVFIPVWLTAPVFDASVGGLRCARHADIVREVDWMAHLRAKCARACPSCDATRDEVYAGYSELILPFCFLMLGDYLRHLWLNKWNNTSQRENV